MAFGESWHIRSRTHTCVVTGKHFVDGEVIVAAIFPDPESSGWLRKDYSIDGWEQSKDERVGQFSQWKTQYKAPVASEKLEVTKESPIDLLRRLVEEEEEHTEKVRFILAVMLERQKVLVEKDTQAVPSGILRVYEHRKEGDVFLINKSEMNTDKHSARTLTNQHYKVNLFSLAHRQTHLLRPRRAQSASLPLQLRSI